MFSFQQNKLRQIYDKWYIKTQILRYVSACSVGRKTYCTNYTFGSAQTSNIPCIEVVFKAIERAHHAHFFSAMFHRIVFIAVYSNLVIAKNVTTKAKV